MTNIPYKFKFYHKEDKSDIFTAQLVDLYLGNYNKCLVGWIENGEIEMTDYDFSTVQNAVDNGVWIISEVMVE